MKCWDQAGLHWPFPRFTPLSSLSSLPLSYIFSSPADWVFDEWKSTERIYTMTSFYYYDQNPSGFCFLVQIRAFVVEASWITKFKYERKNGMNFGRSSKKDVIVQMACLMVC